MDRTFLTMTAMGLVAAMTVTVSANSAFNGQGENQTDAFGYYYVITGGKFPNGQTVNGLKATGGTMKYLLDDPAWGYPIDTWRADGWFEETAGVALTMTSGGSIVFDNNGIEDGTYGTFYDATADPGDADNANPKDQVTSADKPGLYRGYSMSNNFDWIYAGYFKIDQPITVDTVIGYFDETAGFDHMNPNIAYRMNIWSSYWDGGLVMPVNTGSFAGDVFSSDFADGQFTANDTGVDRVFGPDYGSMTDDIFRLSFTPDDPITLQPGEYFFSHDATIVPEPLTMLAVGLSVTGLGAYVRRRFN